MRFLIKYLSEGWELIEGRHRCGNFVCRESCHSDSAWSVRIHFCSSFQWLSWLLVFASMITFSSPSDQLNSIKWASETSSISRFFPSEYGTDIEHNSSSPSEKPHQLKLKVRAYARTIPKEKLHFTYLVTGPYSELYMGKSASDDMGTFDVKARKAVLLGTGDEKVAFSSMPEYVSLLPITSAPSPISFNKDTQRGKATSSLHSPPQGIRRQSSHRQLLHQHPTRNPVWVRETDRCEMDCVI